MSWIDKLKPPKISSSNEKKASFPEGLWTKCPSCSEIVFQEDLGKNLMVCPKCDYHLRIKARERLKILLEEDSFEELDKEMSAKDPLGFKDTKKYRDRIKALEKKGGEKEAYIYGRGRIRDLDIVVGAFVFEYMGGSMGSVVGEKLTRTFELALQEKMNSVIL